MKTIVKLKRINKFKLHHHYLYAIVYFSLQLGTTIWNLLSNDYIKYYLNLIVLGTIKWPVLHKYYYILYQYYC